MKMDEFTALLGNLTHTCQELEEIKAEQTKDYERVSRSFEKVLLSILRQEQNILNQMEEEHGRLRDQLSTIQKSNEKALQEGISEINSMVHEITTISSNLKQALGTTNDNDCVMKEIKDRLSKIFAKKKSFIIHLRKVYFTPHQIMFNTLGEIRCEEQSLGFSVSCHKSKRDSACEAKKSVMLSDEQPPWEDVSPTLDNTEYVGVKVLLSSDSDPESGSTTKVGQEKGEAVTKKTDTISPRDRAVLEADNAALSPRTATKIWISDIKHSPPDMPLGRGKDAIHNVSDGECNKTLKPHSTSTKNTLKESPSVVKTSFKVLRNVLSKEPTYTKSRNIGTTRGTQHNNHSTTLQQVPHRPASTPSVMDLQTNGTTVEDTGLFEQDTLFRATATFVCDDDSESSDDAQVEVRGDGRDPRACREVAIRDSRVPSARKTSDGDQMTAWMSMEPCSNSDNQSLNTQDDHSCVDQLTDSNNSPPLDYMRMTDEKPDMDNENLRVSPRSQSPAESVKSSYTFIIDSPKTKKIGVNLNKARSVSKLLTKQSKKGHPIINGAAQTSEIKAPFQAPRSKQTVHLQPHGHPPTHLTSNMRKQTLQPIPAKKSVPRSTSMPYIERITRQLNVPSRPLRPTSAIERRGSTSSGSSNFSNPRRLVTSAPSANSRVRGKSTQYKRKPLSRVSQKPQSRVKSLSKSEPNLIDLSVDEDGTATRLVRQFGKFGSGRAELNLPHGLYASPTGSLYVVDYGNKRLQVMDTKGKLLQQITLEAKNYFDVAVSNRGLVVLTNSTDRTLEVYTKHGRLLQVISKNWGAPRGITVNYRDEFIVADMRLGVMCALTLDPSTGRQKESTIIPGFNKPYLVGSNSQGLLAISERGFDGGSCVKVLKEDWQLLRVLGTKATPGPTLYNPWGVCIDSEGGVLVADWAHAHSIIYYPARKPAQILVTEGLSSPRGLALCQDNLLMVADSMHNCIKVFQYQDE
ncbi:uncharacterized protein O3C94_023103 [Discoglossus pictus]